MSRRRREYSLYRRGKVWHFITWIDGRRFRGTTGKQNYHDAHKEARCKIDEEVKRRQEEVTGLAARGDDSITRVLAGMVAEKQQEGKRQGYIRKLIQHGRDHIIPYFGASRRIDSIPDTELEAFKGALMAKLDRKTTSRVLTTLRQTFKFAERRGICRAPRLPDNVSVRIQEEVERWQILSESEIEKVLKLVPHEARPALVFLSNIGGRTSMAPAVHRTMCDFRDPKRPRVHFPASMMKGRKKLTVDLNAAALNALQVGLQQHGDRPFPLPDWKLRKLWNKAREAAGYPTLRIHDLRHSRVSALLKDNPPHVVRDMVGHCSLVVTNLYAHSSDEARRKAARSVVVNVDLEVNVDIDPQASEKSATATVTATKRDSDSGEE